MCMQIFKKCVVLFHDNTCSHKSRVTQVKRPWFKREQLDHSPYSPDMSPRDFHAFGLLKKHLKEQRFNSDGELKDAVKD